MHALIQNFRGKNFEIMTKNETILNFLLQSQSRLPHGSYIVQKSRESIKSKISHLGTFKWPIFHEFWVEVTETAGVGK